MRNKLHELAGTQKVYNAHIMTVEGLRQGNLVTITHTEPGSVWIIESIAEETCEAACILDYGTKKERYSIGGSMSDETRQAFLERFASLAGE
ncbi:MAG: hypothetical protein AAB612_04000 [Patescibacteria group bacterium]